MPDEGMVAKYLQHLGRRQDRSQCEIIGEDNIARVDLQR